MSKYSLGKLVVGSHWMESGAIANADGSISKGFEMEPLSSGNLEEAFQGPMSDQVFTKLADLLTRLPNNFEGQILFSRRGEDSVGVPGFVTRIYVFEKASKVESYSHVAALLGELKATTSPLSHDGWRSILSGFCGKSVLAGVLPDMVWEQDCVRLGESVTRVLSLTELPQLEMKNPLN